MNGDTGDASAALEGELLPMFAGGFGLRVTLRGDEAVAGVSGAPGTAMRLVCDRRVVGIGRREHLLVVEGGRPPFGQSALSLIVSRGGQPPEWRPIDAVPFSWQPASVAMLRSAIAEIIAEDDRERDWTQFVRALAENARLAVRADISIPIGAGMGLILDGELPEPQSGIACFAREGSHLHGVEATAAPCRATGRTVLYIPEIAGRYFLQLDGNLIDVACPHGATRSDIVGDPEVAPLDRREAEQLLTLVGLSGGAGEAPMIPSPLLGALPSSWRWRIPGGSSGLGVQLMAIEETTVAFVKLGGALGHLGEILLQDLDGKVTPLVDEAEVLCAFLDEGEEPAATQIVVLSPRALPGGVARIRMIGEPDGSESGWTRLLVPGDPAAMAAVAAAAPGGERIDDYVRRLALPMRSVAGGREPVVARLSAGALRPVAPPGVAAAATDPASAPAPVPPLDVVLLAIHATLDSVERSLTGLFLTTPADGAPVCVILGDGPGFKASAAAAGRFAEAFGRRIDVVAAASLLGLAAAVTASTARPAVAIFEAGAVPRHGDWFARTAAAVPADGIVLPPDEATDGPSAIVVAGSVRDVVRSLEGRIGSLAAMGAAVRLTAEELHVAVVRSPALETVIVGPPGDAAGLDTVADRMVLDVLAASANAGVN